LVKTVASGARAQAERAITSASNPFPISIAAEPDDEGQSMNDVRRMEIQRAEALIR